jgi:hypothetical protein
MNLLTSCLWGGGAVLPGHAVATWWLTRVATQKDFVAEILGKHRGSLNCLLGQEDFFFFRY